MKWLPWILLVSCAPPEPVDTTLASPPPSNNIRNHLNRVASDLSEQTLSPDNWQQVRSTRYQQFLEMISLSQKPIAKERSTPKVTVTGTVQGDGYRIEKLYYESSPGLYVPANLYLPDKLSGPTAGIIYLCGHSRTQKTHYQTHPEKFARLGFVCLIPETIQWGEVEGEHWGCYANGWFNWYSKGYTPAGVEVWNAIRGLDLLAAMPEVDADRLGATGISGGGAISWFLGAVDSRVKAVAPVCGISTLSAQLNTRTIDGHCDCMMFINTYGWASKDVGALIAPRPLLIAQSDRDGLNQVESVREIYQDLSAFYKGLGVSENIDYIETPGGHSYHQMSRQGIFSFFMKHLMDQEISPQEVGDIDESSGSLFSNDELMVYTDGPPEGDITTTIQESFIALPDSEEPENMDVLRTYTEKVKSSLIQRTFHNFPGSDVPLEPELIFRNADFASHGGDKYLINTEDGWKLKTTIYWRNPKNEKKPMMVILRNPNEPRNDSERFSYQLDDHWNVMVIDVRGVGESGWSQDLHWHARRASAWSGRTLASMRVYDLLRFLEFTRTLPGVDVGKIGIAARGELGVVALYGALLDGNCHTLVLDNPPPTQNASSNKDGRGEAIEMLNCLQITDVNQLPALLQPTQTVFLGTMPESYQWSLKTLSNVGKAETIQQIASLEDLKIESLTR